MAARRSEHTLFKRRAATECRPYNGISRALFASLASFGRVADGPAIRGGRHSILLSEIMYEVCIRANPHVLQHLLHGEKRGPQHLLSLAQPVFFEILRGTHSRFLFEEVAETRRREIHQRGETCTVPRGRGFAFYL